MEVLGNKEMRPEKTAGWGGGCYTELKGWGGRASLATRLCPRGW